MSYSISIRPFGIHAVLIEWPNEVDESILNDILHFKNFLISNCLQNEEWELIPAYNSLTLVRLSESIDFKDFTNKLSNWYDQKKDASIKFQRYLCRLPVCYDLNFGIDLLEISERLQLSTDEIIKQHTKSTYRVYGIGFLPGFMYLGGLPGSLEIPRRAEPRLKVASGSVGLAGKQTGIYPQESPGGWNIIGNCSVPIFNVERPVPCIVNVGDQVQFYSISKAEYDLHKIESEVGIYKIEKIAIDA
ncbi:5-oxoprolinase subunit PxpB [Aurantibacter crassamenti]|uniref:5-oxoprolinase subunit PxpB n=1 Tax=Aurantibacter crassamenti TaxID=1837375 RepID=UPI001EEF00BC|nr:5-oxoprolinase subunit PxpB [Aurantibacter crassamenti]